MGYLAVAVGGIAMRRALILVTLCLAFSWNGLAQQTDADAPATKEDVQRYLDVMHSHDMMKQMVEAMSKPLHRMVHEDYMKNKDKLPPDFEARMDKMMDDLLNGMPFDEMMQAMVPTYQKHFTKGELNALAGFYGSPTGQKILRELPAIMSEAMESMMPIMRRNIERITQSVQQETAEMLKESNRNGARNAPATRN
jgi:hypothetical protein